MITGEPSYRDLSRDNVLDVFTSAKYLKIKGNHNFAKPLQDHNYVSYRFSGAMLGLY